MTYSYSTLLKAEFELSSPTIFIMVLPQSLCSAGQAILSWSVAISSYDANKSAVADHLRSTATSHCALFAPPIHSATRRTARMHPQPHVSPGFVVYSIARGSPDREMKVRTSKASPTLLCSWLTSSSLPSLPFLNPITNQLRPLRLPCILLFVPSTIRTPIIRNGKGGRRKPEAELHEQFRHCGGPLDGRRPATAPPCSLRATCPCARFLSSTSTEHYSHN